MKLLIAALLVIGSLSYGTVSTVTQSRSGQTLHVAPETNGQELGVQSVQGGEDNTSYMIQPAAADYSGRAYIQAQPDNPEVQPALGYQAIHWTK